MQRLIYNFLRRSCGVPLLLLWTISALAQSRPYQMSTSAIQFHPGQTPNYQNYSVNSSLQNLGTESDVISIFPEYLGVPFDAFALSATPPANDPWTIQMNTLAAAAKTAGKPLMVEIVLTRDVIVAKATNNNGALMIQSGWAPGCVDFTSSQYSNLGPAYVNYAAWIAKAFKPKYLVVMVEANLYYVHCGGQTGSWNVLVATERTAYDTVKAANPNTIVFPSFNLEGIYDQQLNGFDQAQYNALSGMKRDRLGLATYPYGMQITPYQFVNPYQLPADYLTRIRDRNSSEPKIAITETGWNSDSVALSSGGQCYSNLLFSDAAYQSAYLNYVIYYGWAGALDVISWWSDRDLIDSTVMNTCYPDSVPPNYPECNSDQWCIAVNNARAQTPPGWSPAFSELAFKAFGGMGLRSYDGTAKPGVVDQWNHFLAMPVASQ